MLPDTAGIGNDPDPKKRRLLKEGKGVPRHHSQPLQSIQHVWM